MARSEGFNETAPGADSPFQRPGQSLIVIGPTPPPYHGVAVMIKRLVHAPRDRGLLAAHLETGSAAGQLDRAA
jgi:hypothetical protein